MKTWAEEKAEIAERYKGSGADPVACSRAQTEALGRRLERARDAIFEAWRQVSDLVPVCRERSCVLTKLDEARLWTHDVPVNL